jgi:gliding motility-associated-like protein
MNKLFTLKLTFIFFLFLYPEVYSQNWTNSFVINGNNIEPNFSSIDQQSNLVVLSSFDTTYNPFFKSYGKTDLLISKISPTGSLLWNKQIGGTLLDVAGGVCIDNDDNIYITGYFYNANLKVDETTTLVNTGNADIFLLKYTSGGNLLWAKNIGKSKPVQGSLDIKFDGKSNLIMAGYFKDSLIIGNGISDDDTLIGNGYNNNFIAKFDLNGILQFSKQIKGDNNLSRIVKIAISPNGYYFGGFFQGNLFFDTGTISSLTSTAFDVFIYKTDFNGDGQWTRRIRGNSTENFRTLTTDEFDNIYLLGNFNSPTIYIDSTETVINTLTGSSDGYDTFIGKYNRSGILQWFIRKGSPAAKDIYNDFVVRNNVIYATGYFGNKLIFNQDTLKVSQSNVSDAFLAAFNEIGNPLGGISIQGTDNDKVTAITNAGTIVNMDANSRAYISGYYRSQQIKIGTQTYTSTNKNKSDLFFAIYKHPLLAAFTRTVFVSCNGLSDGLLKVTPYFGKAPYTYTWDHDANLHDSIATNLRAGDYSVTVKDAKNEVFILRGTIIEPAPLAINALITPVTCNNLNTGAIDITVTGGTKTSDYVYHWSSLDGSGITTLAQDQTGLTNGTYSVIVTDDNLCTKTNNFVVTQPAKIDFAGSTVTNLTFPPGNNGAIDLHISGGNSPYATQWTGPSGFTSAVEDPSGLTYGGLYSVALTDNKNCLADTSLVVNDGTTLIAQVTARTPVLCFGDDNGSAEITAINGIPPYNYQWSDGISTPLNVRTNMASGTYQVLVTDAASPVPHTTQVEVVIAGPVAPLSTLLVPTQPFCYQDSGTIDLTVSGGTLPFRYLWNTGYKGEDLSKVPGGSYSVTVTDTNNCSAQNNVVITEPDVVTLDVTIDSKNLCNGDNTASATANVTGGSGNYSYLWDDPGAQVTKTAVQLFAGNYTVKVTDQNNCSISQLVPITEPDSLKVTGAITAPSCFGSSDAAIVPNVTGGTPLYDFVWSNNVFQRINSNIPAGTYSVAITDLNNCSVADTFVINDPVPVVINQVDSVNATCFGSADGSIHVDASGGTGPLNYSADNGLTFIPSPDIGSLTGGLYMVVVKDSNDCASAAHSITVDQPDEITFDTVLVTDATCYGYTNGAITIAALGGTGVYEYSSDNGASFIPSPTIVSLENGNYQVVVRDSSNCLSAAYPVKIGPDEAFTVDTIEVVRGTLESPLGSITLENTGGISPVNFVIIPDSSSNTSGVFNDLPAENYRVFAVDDSSCKSNELLVSLPEPEPIPETGIVVYDAFSPNGDGKNDVWHISGIGNYPNCSVKIFNTWGVAVFTSNGYGTPWDGKYKGNDLPSGTYYYVIDPGDGSADLTGPVSLVK